MLAKRIIPTLLQRGHTLVKGMGYDGWRSVGAAQQAMRIHAARGVDELIYLDIAATPDGRGPDFAMVERLTANFYTPITVGGGVRTVEDVRLLLAAGADKVAICTAMFKNTALLRTASDKFGSQAICAAIDVRDDVAWSQCGTWRTPFDPVLWAQDAQRQGAGEILLSSIERDGTMRGYDLDLIREVANAVDIPVIASGGCSGYADMLAAIRAGASAVAAGALFQFTDCTPRGAAEYLQSHGVEVRL
jgi:cyclase